MTATEQVILVDEKDNPVGTAEKLLAHRAGLCHRAFSVFILRKREEWEVLLQQRAKTKYHSPLLWTNTCCSHPRPGEDIIAAGERRLEEELGLVISLHSIGVFHYIASFNNGLTENEVDHVLVGLWKDEAVIVNPNEVEETRWITFSDLKVEMLNEASRFTPWIGEAFELVENNLKKVD